MAEEVRKFEIIYNPILTAYHNKDKKEYAMAKAGEDVIDTDEEDPDYVPDVDKWAELNTKY